MAMNLKRNGSLSYEDFQVSKEALCDIHWKENDSAGPRWSWIQCPSPIALCKDEGYLSLENVYRRAKNEDHVDDKLFLEKDENEDKAVLVEDENEVMHVYDFHIVYNFSYKVPVLYFRGHSCDGQPLNLKEIEKDLPVYSMKILRESKWTYITQEEHPFLRRPWYMLHPCGTSEWMKLLFGDREPDTRQYLLSWLTVVGQAVGLKIPLEIQTKFSPSQIHINSPRNC